jgi:hypothetical protein
MNGSGTPALRKKISGIWPLDFGLIDGIDADAGRTKVL